MHRRLHRRLIRLVLALAGSAALSATALAGSAQAAHPGPWSTDSVLRGTLGWTRLGPVAGSPGNAHSGTLIVQTDEGYASVESLDWTCPRGVRPPTGLDTSGPCDLLLSTDSTPADPSTGVVETGPLAVSLRGTWDVSATSWHDGTPGGPTSYQRTLRADVTRVGPLEVSSTDQVGGGTETRTTTYTASMRLRGYVPETTLDSRSQQSSDWTREVVQTRSVG